MGTDGRWSRSQGFQGSWITCVTVLVLSAVLCGSAFITLSQKWGIENTVYSKHHSWADIELCPEIQSLAPRSQNFLFIGLLNSELPGICNNSFIKNLSALHLSQDYLCNGPVLSATACCGFLVSVETEE